MNSCIGRLIENVNNVQRKTRLLIQLNKKVVCTVYMTNCMDKTTLCLSVIIPARPQQH